MEDNITPTPVVDTPQQTAPAARSIDGVTAPSNTAVATPTPTPVTTPDAAAITRSKPISITSANTSAPSEPVVSNMPVVPKPVAKIEIKDSSEITGPPNIEEQPTSTDNITPVAVDPLPEAEVPQLEVAQPPQQPEIPAAAKLADEIIPGLDSSSPQIPLANDAKSPTPSILEAAKAELASIPEAAAITQPTPSKHIGKKFKKFGAITLAILVALALIGGAGYAYLQKNKDSKKTVTPAIVKEVTPVKNPATSKDVTSASEAIDASLKKVDDTKDYQEADLSDTSLGL